MIAELQTTIDEHRQAIYVLLRRYLALGRPLLLRSELMREYEAFVETEDGRPLRGTTLGRLIAGAQEAVAVAPSLHLAVRLEAGRSEYLHLHTEELSCRQVPASEFLAVKERVVDGHEAGGWALEVDLAPFERGFPRMQEKRSIGRGVEFLNRHLSGRLFDQLGKGDEALFHFLRQHEQGGQQLMLNGLLRSLGELREALRSADRVLEVHAPDASWEVVGHDLRRLGFEPGWGEDVLRIRETMDLLRDVLEAPSPDHLASFLARVPMIFSIAILSPHGYFGQSGVLGKPDTGGQIVYILDQVRALEKEMRRSIQAQGLDIEPEIVVITRLIPEAEGTTCDQRLERILGTERARILRVPFRDEVGEVAPAWITRFKVWPYLERFAAEAERELLVELGERPDIVVGNYSDGNLVASLMSQSLGVTQCNIAHALEKTKYLYSDLYWREHEEEHSFACQYTADLIAMNTADFIITSTYQEIAGTSDAVGQYESYGSFTLPGLYRVVNGIDVYDPKFNIVSPGADPDVFFPYTDGTQRPSEIRQILQDLVYGGPSDETRGCLSDERRPLLMAMSRLDRIKNMAGLLEWYAKSTELRECAHLLLVGGSVDPARSQDAEEREQIEHMHGLFEEHGLEDCVRWVPMQTDKMLVGELYRFVADTGGAFVQPALFEAFGLTVVEAMSSGLPTFATRYGGPSEIIVDGESGFHLDPNHGDEAASRIAGFLRAARDDAAVWQRISEGALQRVQERYTWKQYAERLLTLSRIYGFWRFITDIEREETQRYLQMFYGLMYRELANRIPTH